MKKSNPFWRALLIQILGTALGVLLTLGTGQLLAHRKQVQNRRMTAMMVLSNIESFCRNMEENANELARLDTLATWLLALPHDQIPQMDQRQLMGIINEVENLPMLMKDKTAENIFSNNISTWENLGNFRFIDQVGQCFFQMNWAVDHWESGRLRLHDLCTEIMQHPDDYPGKAFCDKYLQNMQVRGELTRIHSSRNWFEANAAIMRVNNRTNMQLIGITEQEVMDFTNALADIPNAEDHDQPLQYKQYPRLNSDSLYTMPAIAK